MPLYADRLNVVFVLVLLVYLFCANFLLYEVKAISGISKGLNLKFKYHLNKRAIYREK
jgi:hypothetical protein